MVAAGFFGYLLQEGEEAVCHDFDVLQDVELGLQIVMNSHQLVAGRSVGGSKAMCV